MNISSSIRDQSSNFWRSSSLSVVALLCFSFFNAFAQDASRPSRLHRLFEGSQSPDKQIAGPDQNGWITTAGTYQFELTVDGRRRKYLAHVPMTRPASLAWPVLFAFHGGGGNMNLQADDSRYGLISKSESAGFIAIFPNGTGPMSLDTLATWNAGNCCGGARDKNVDDVSFVRAIVADVIKRFPVDRERFFATGMSNGGMFSHRLACEMADIFRAVSSVAGTDGTLNCQPSRPISVLHIHAKDDDHVLYLGGAGKDAFRDASKVADFTSVPQTIQRWLVRNSCNAAPTRTLEVPGAECAAYGGCLAGVSVQLCSTDHGGHSWPGASEVRAGKAPASTALSANDVMWEFFSRAPPARLDKTR